MVRRGFVRPERQAHRESNVDKEHIKGTAQKAEGAVKDAFGKLTGNEKLQAEGKADKAAGSARQAAGDVKDAAGNVADAVKR